MLWNLDFVKKDNFIEKKFIRSSNFTFARPDDEDIEPRISSRKESGFKSSPSKEYERQAELQRRIRDMDNKNKREI